MKLIVALQNQHRFGFWCLLNMHISMKNVHPCDFKPIQHILSVHSNVTAVTTMCFIGGIAFMTVVDCGNALFVPLGHLLDHPIFIIIVTITPSSSSSNVIFHIKHRMPLWGIGKRFRGIANVYVWSVWRRVGKHAYAGNIPQLPLQYIYTSTKATRTFNLY